MDKNLASLMRQQLQIATEGRIFWRFMPVREGVCSSLDFCYHKTGLTTTTAAQKQRRITARAAPIKTCFINFFCKEMHAQNNRQQCMLPIVPGFE